MAGDWIKFEVSTPEKQEVLAITVSMGWDDPDLTVGKLLRVWRWFDQQTIDGNARSVTTSLLDRIAGVTGFAKAMAEVGWLFIRDEGVELPNFNRHNGKTAKDRALTAKRVANHKSNAKTNDAGNGGTVTSALPREEKRREEEKNSPNPSSPDGDEGEPAGEQGKKKRERKPRITLKTFVERCAQAGEKPISEYLPLLEYVDATGLPMDFIQLCWQEFKHEFLPGGKGEARLQADWRRHFLNYAKKGYYRLWYARPDGTYDLTTQGIQAQKFHNRAAA